MADATEVLSRLVTAQREQDVDALVSCWHSDADGIHMLRPDHSWHGMETYRRVMTCLFDASATSREDFVCSAVDGNRFFLETATHHADGSVVPCVAIFEVEDGKIRRARIYTDVPRRDGKSMDNWIHELND
jgi:limonene-1,2-epoxide hydrolase